LLYAAGSQFDSILIGVGAERIRKLFEEARKNAPCIIFIDEIDAVAGKRKTGENPFESAFSRMTINQLLQEMDGFKAHNDIIVIGATNLKGVLDPAVLRPGRFDLVIDVPQPNKKGRKDILQHYFEKVKHDSSINVERLASITDGLNGSELENIVNQAAIRAVRQGHEQVDTSHLEYAFDKITMGPELLSMEQSADGMRKVAIHEGGHCLAAYLLNKAGEFDLKPRKATITRRGDSLGHVAYQQDEKTDEESKSLQSLRAELVVDMAGRAAEAIFFGEEKVSTGSYSDMENALRIATRIVCDASGHANQIRGRMIDTEDSSEKKKEHVDDLIDHEIDFAYKRATQLLNENAKLHHLLIDAMMKFKTLDLDEIELLMKTKSLRDIEKRRTEVEKSRLEAKTPTIKERAPHFKYALIFLKKLVQGWESLQIPIPISYHGGRMFRIHLFEIFFCRALCRREPSRRFVPVNREKTFKHVKTVSSINI
jgi:ATP-dependent metalloprotease